MGSTLSPGQERFLVDQLREALNEIEDGTTIRIPAGVTDPAKAATYVTASDLAVANAMLSTAQADREAARDTVCTLATEFQHCEIDSGQHAEKLQAAREAFENVLAASVIEQKAVRNQRIIAAARNHERPFAALSSAGK